MWGHVGGKNSTNISTHLLPWLLSISCSVKVIKVSVQIKKKLEVCRLGHSVLLLRCVMLLLPPLFTQCLQEMVASSLLTQSMAQFLQECISVHC